MVVPMSAFLKLVPVTIPARTQRLNLSVGTIESVCSGTAGTLIRTISGDRWVVEDRLADVMGMLNRIDP